MIRLGTPADHAAAETEFGVGYRMMLAIC